jgi:uncharacterized protein
MKINILNIPEEGLNLRFSLVGDSFSGLLPDREELDFSLPRVDVSGFMKKVGQNLFISGTIETVMETQCCRCLEEAHLPLKAEFSYTLLPETEAVKADIELKTEDIEVGYYSGEVIDLSPIIFEQILLQTPMKALCGESCRGICPRCGINLNVGSCDCRSDFIDERLAVLKNFRVQKN